MKSFPGKLLFPFAGILFWLGSCDIINPAEDIPAYLQVDSFGIYTNEQTQGSASSNIADVWVTIDGNFLCGYPLGTKVPVLYSGTHRVSLRSGILLNGIESTRVPYAVFQTYDTTLNLEPGKVHVLSPRVTYFSNTQFPLIEDFSSSSLKFSTPITSASMIVESNGPDGNCGLVILDGTHPEFECMTTDSFDLPGGTTPTYIEINYKCEAEFLVGIKANTSLGPLDFPLLHIRSSDTWKKIYVNLTTIASQAQHAEDWKIYIRSELEQGAVADTLRFDNIKLVF